MQKKPQKGRLLPWAIVGFFAVIALVNGTFMYFAFDTHPGVEAEGAYERGLEYNQVIEAAKANDALGWQVTLDAKMLTEGAAAISIRVSDAEGVPLENLAIQGKAIWPVKEGRDKDFIMEEVGEGLYSTRVPLDLGGQWEIRVYLEDQAGQKFQFGKRVVL